jgi:hypothetical protein
VNANTKYVCVSELVDKLGTGSAVVADSEFGICM